MSPRKSDAAAAEAAEAVVEATSAAEKTEAADAAEPPKRKRGRPRKNPLPEEGADGKAEEPQAEEASAEKPKRGRPRKKAAEEEVPAAEAAQAAPEPAPAAEAPASAAEPKQQKTTVVRKNNRTSGGNNGSYQHNNGQKNNNGRQNQQNNQKHNNNNNRRQRNNNHNNQPIQPSVTKEELAALKVADLRERAAAYNMDASGLKKAELIDSLYDTILKAEGFAEVEGILDIMADGYGFLRASGYLPGDHDVYVGLSTIRRNGLRRGDHVTGQTRPARSNEKFAAIQKVFSVNGIPIDELTYRPRFADLTPIFPDERMTMEHGKNTITARVVDLVAPVGKGQRGLIVSPPKAGKTTILKDIAASITANNPQVHLMYLGIDERPEEATDMERSIRGEVISSTFDMPSENHIAVAELVIERAKRLVEQGKDVVILLDSITRLARAYNLAQPASGRILSGGVDSTALYPPKRFLGAARNIEGGGSLTILASALIDTGSKMDEVIFEEFKGTGNMELKLDRNLADRRIFPAIDPVSSGTRKEELLLDPQEAPLIWAVRRILGNMNNTERSMDMLIKSLKQTDTNEEFLMRTAKKAQTHAAKSDENFEF